MEKIFTILFSFLFTGLVAQSQEVSDKNIGELIDTYIIQSKLSSNSNLAKINQEGSGNEMITIQQHQGSMTNTIISNQVGNYHVGYIKQIGADHSTKLLQSGEGNEANLWSVGQKSETMVYQNGNSNMINSYIDNQGCIGKGAALIQRGENNNIEIALLGNGFLFNSWPRAAFIEQKGNGLEISAKMESYTFPIYVEQQSGPSGGGMKVDISNSDFSFPMK